MIDQELLEIFSELAPIEGLSQKENRVAEYIHKFLTQLDYDVVEDNSASITNSNTGNLICRKGDGGSIALLSQNFRQAAAGEVLGELEQRVGHVRVAAAEHREQRLGGVGHHRPHPVHVEPLSGELLQARRAAPVGIGE